MLAFEAGVRPMARAMAHPGAKDSSVARGARMLPPANSMGFLAKLLTLTIAYAPDWRQNLSNHMPAEILRGYFGFWWVPGCP
jgi:hypothetical protein